MKKLLQNDRIYHLWIWLLLIVPRGIGSMYIVKNSLWLYLLNLLLQNGLLLLLIYINLLYLIPRLYEHKRYKPFFTILAGLTILHVISVHFLNEFVYNKMGFNEERNTLIEIPFYFFNTAQYLVISFLLYGLQERFRQKKQISEMQVEKLNTEMNYLKAQINPHFLFNTLNNLYALSLEKSDKAPETILMLSKMMDYMLYETSESKVSLKKEIENIENYIGLERIRQGNQAKINFLLKGDISDQKIVPLILLPLIENAFKHGVNQLIYGAYISIILTINKENLELSVENNYKTNETHKSHGIGLINLNKQLALFYKDTHKLLIQKDTNLYKALLTLDLS
ncbi:sensor histidine kinase [Emticicia sp. BO119]|uniref:sensor histidine kinase n=1 Tax=Emticicia sp. BO119 TaxID=2757768 RepID=UPI0015F090F7|nr:sensor histidine kinase [Emticicia sp. BO119]MBA4850889.1 sensor histidine kinase [Emticicia sp. BO119]